MFIVTVFPITRGAFKERLSYWSSHKLNPGSIINVPLRGREIPALIETVQPASHAKSDIKNASFMTRKLEKTVEHAIVHPACIKAAEKTALYYASNLGGVVKAVIPEVILSDTTPVTLEALPPRDADVLPEILTYQSSDEDRHGSYKSIVREEFARKKSVLIMVPTTTQAEELQEIIKKGIESYVITLHSALSKKQQRTNWDKVLRSEHTVVIIATPTFISVPRADISTIIIDKESSRAYLNPRAPYIDYRTYTEYYAQEIGARLILADILLRIESLYRREHGEIGDLFQPSFRLDQLPQTIIIDTADKKRKEEKGFSILSEELVSMIQYAEKRGEHMFIYCARRGLSPQTVCGDCGQTVLCDFCSAPVVLHNTKNEEHRYFLCHHCGHKRSALETCRQCNSWKLITLGIAVDNVYAEIQKQFPTTKLFKLDRDSVKNDKQAKELIKQFEATPGAIIVGTETALTFMPKIKHVAIASIDSLFSLPDFRVNERVCHILLRLLACAETYFLIQTRNAHNPLLKQITSGSLVDFYRDEITMRQAINYPPFAVHIKITVEGMKDHVAHEMEKLQEILAPWQPMIFPAFIPTIKGQAILHMLISIAPQDWPDAKLRDILVALPRECIVKINPESLL